MASDCADGYARESPAGETDKIDDLDYHGLLALNLGLSAYAAQNAVAVAT